MTSRIVEVGEEGLQHQATPPRPPRWLDPNGRLPWWAFGTVDPTETFTWPRSARRQTDLRCAGRLRFLQILWPDPRALGDAREHARPNLVAVVEGPDEVGEA